MVLKLPLVDLYETILSARTKPTPGSRVKASTSARLISTRPEEASLVDNPEGWFNSSSRHGTTRCMPSVTRFARFTASSLAPGSTPPTPAMASATRLPAGRLVSPGENTAPETCTVTISTVFATGEALVAATGSGSLRISGGAGGFLHRPIRAAATSPTHTMTSTTRAGRPDGGMPDQKSGRGSVISSIPLACVGTCSKPCMVREESSGMGVGQQELSLAA